MIKYKLGERTNEKRTGEEKITAHEGYNVESHLDESLNSFNVLLLHPPQDYLTKIQSNHLT